MSTLHALGICLSLALVYGGVRFTRRTANSLLPALLWLSFGAALLLGTVVDLLAGGRLSTAFDPLLGGLTAGEARLLVLFAAAGFVFAVLNVYAAARARSRRIAQLHQEIALLHHEVERLREDDPAGGARDHRERLDDD